MVQITGSYLGNCARNNLCIRQGPDCAPILEV
jgi:hypothetical protein